MEAMYEIIDKKQPIPDFVRMTKEALGELITKLQLHMTVRDLAYCQTQYRMRERRNPTPEELCLLDKLYLHRTGRLEYYGLRSFYTSDPQPAQTYADLMAKAAQLHREEHPFTPAELSSVLTKTLVKAGRRITVPSLRIGESAPLQLLAHGTTEIGSATLGNTTAVIGKAWERIVPLTTPPQSSEHILLLSPTGHTPAAFADAVAALPLPPKVQMVSVGTGGLLEALLRWDGVYLVQNYLPKFDSDTPLSELVTACNNSLLLRLDGEAALPLRDAAATVGITASIIGKFTANQYLTIRREGATPLQWETAFLRAFSPTLPADAELPGNCMLSEVTEAIQAPQTVMANGDCPLFAAAIPDTPYAITGHYLICGATSRSDENTFRAAFLATMHAINRAVAAGADPDSLTLTRRIVTPKDTDPNMAVGEIMAALLGAYRVQAELALPDINGQFISSIEPTPKASLTVFSAAHKPDKPIPHTFSGSGNSVYLLTPLGSEQLPVDPADYRKLLHYVHSLCRDGIALSAMAVNSDNISSALTTMTQSGYGYLATEPLPAVFCGFLIETKQVIQGIQCGVTTATTTIRIGEEESPITSYRLPHLSTDQIPMSPVGVDRPILCLPLTKALGNILPIQNFVQSHGASLKTVPLSNTASRTQMTQFANTMAESNIAVLVGTTEEIQQIFSNCRVSYAKDQLVRHGGLILCLYTDEKAGRNEPIPKDHPFFFGTPALLYDRAAIRFESNNHSIVHMKYDSIAVPRMLACAIAYFQ